MTEAPKDILLTGGPRTGYREMKWRGAPPESIGYKDAGTYVLLYIETDGTAVYGWKDAEWDQRPRPQHDGDHYPYPCDIPGCPNFIAASDAAAKALMESWGTEVQAEGHSGKEWEEHVAGRCRLCTGAGGRT